jgi:cytochrome P450
LQHRFAEVRMRSVSEAQSLLPSAPVRPVSTSSLGIARVLRENALLSFPPEAFEEDVVVRRLFGRLRLTLNLPAGIQHVLIDNPANYRRTVPTMRMLLPLLGRGLLLSEGEDWKHQRRTVAPNFAPRTIPLLAHHVSDATQRLIDDLATGGERPVNLLAEMQSLALDIAGRAMFSLTMDRYGADLRTLITGYAEHLGRPSLLDFLLPSFLPSPRDFARRRFRRRWMALIERVIAERRAMPRETARDDLFDHLSAAGDPDRLTERVATMITAGHETTAVALFWALHIVASTHPVQQRVAEEVASLDISPDGAANALPKLTYTRAVVQETLRLYPPAFTLVRQARGADIAGGVEVPAGAIVFIAPWVLHRHRRLWAEPERFDPERFLPGAPPPDRFAYLPFGVGPRVCIGAQFALTEAVLVLAKLVQAFRIERASNEPVVPVAIVTTQPDHPPLFRLQRRPWRHAHPVQA